MGAVDGQGMRVRGGRCPITRMDGEAKTDGAVGVEVGRVFGDVVENVSWTLVEAEDGCFEVDGGAEVVVIGQFVWVDEEAGWERVEGMERAGGGERGKGETREEGEVEAR